MHLNIVGFLFIVGKIKKEKRMKRIQNVQKSLPEKRKTLGYVFFKAGFSPISDSVTLQDLCVRAEQTPYSHSKGTHNHPQ